MCLATWATYPIVWRCLTPPPLQPPNPPPPSTAPPAPNPPNPHLHKSATVKDLSPSSCGDMKDSPLDCQTCIPGPFCQHTGQCINTPPINSLAQCMSHGPAPGGSQEMHRAVPWGSSSLRRPFRTWCCRAVHVLGTGGVRCTLCAVWSRAQPSGRGWGGGAGPSDGVALPPPPYHTRWQWIVLFPCLSHNAHGPVPPSLSAEHPITRWVHSQPGGM